MLYGFEKLKQKMDELGFPQIASASGFQIIRGDNNRDFLQAYEAGDIDFGNDGIYLNVNGTQLQGYVYIKKYYVTFNPDQMQWPKAHITQCETIDDFISRERYRERYEWSYAETNLVIDRHSGMRYEDISLELCSYCKDRINSGITDTIGFSQTLEQDEIQSTRGEIDIFGYTSDWPRVSREYRRMSNYTCQKCHFQTRQTAHHRYLHTHHVDGDKTNNSPTNLQCLCVLCHAYVDARHEENSTRSKVDAFIRLYRDSLGGNPYLERFERE